MGALRWALDSGIVGQPFFAPRRLIDLYRSHLDRYGEHWRRGSRERRAALPNENGRAGSRRGPTPSMRGAGSWRRSPLDAGRRESSKQWVAAWSRPDADAARIHNSYAIAAKRKLISLLNVPEARLRGVGLHARAQDVVQRAARRLGIFLAVLERHASIEQPVVPG